MHFIQNYILPSLTGADLCATSSIMDALMFARLTVYGVHAHTFHSQIISGTSKRRIENEQTKCLRGARVCCVCLSTSRACAPQREKSTSITAGWMCRDEEVFFAREENINTCIYYIIYMCIHTGPVGKLLCVCLCLC